MQESTTTQGLFDRVASHLLRQNRKSTGISSRACMYRNADGLQCAIGCLIPIDRYMSGLEGNSLIQPIVRATVEASIHRGLTDTEVGLLQRLQRIHDDSQVSDWPYLLKVCAQDFGLTYNDPDENESGINYARPF